LERLALLRNLIEEKRIMHPEGVSETHLIAVHANRAAVSIGTARDDLLALTGEGIVTLSGPRQSRTVTFRKESPTP
jgi:DNA-binding transcriptional ArsR family regulator